VCRLKGKFRPRTGHEGPEGEWRYSSTLSLTSALGGGVVNATSRLCRVWVRFSNKRLFYKLQSATAVTETRVLKADHHTLLIQQD
jgi:hypothetical protein